MSVVSRRNATATVAATSARGVVRLAHVCWIIYPQLERPAASSRARPPDAGASCRCFVVVNGRRMNLQNAQVAAQLVADQKTAVSSNSDKIIRCAFLACRGASELREATWACLDGYWTQILGRSTSRLVVVHQWSSSPGFILSSGASLACSTAAMDASPRARDAGRHAEPLAVPPPLAISTSKQSPRGLATTHGFRI